MRPPSYHRKNSRNVRRKKDDQSLLAKCPLRLPVEDNCTTPLNQYLRVENEDDVYESRDTLLRNAAV